MADFNKESESKLFFCCLETFPPYFQPFLKTLVTDISESVSDGQHFPVLYSSAKSISSHFFLLNHQGPLYRQTHYTFAVKRSLNKFQNKLISIFPLVMDKKNLSTLTPILSNVFARLSISVLDRHFTCQCFEKTERVARHYKKIKRNKTSKISLEFDRN